MPDQRPQDAPFPGVDEGDAEAERISPPEQVPTDEAAGGPQADDAPKSDEEAAAQLGDFA